MRYQRVVGIDLAGSDRRPSGICFLSGRQLITKLIYLDEEILSEVEEFKPLLVAIDAPLSLPIGKTLNSRYCVRKCDEELRRFGIKFFPINFAGMRSLTERGIKLRKQLESRGIRTIETYPGAFYDLFGLPRPKSKGMIPPVLEALKERFSLKVARMDLSVHEIDSIACALVGLLYLKGETISLGDPKEGLMILPKPLK